MRPGSKVVVVTNQSGAARGYFPAALVDEVHGTSPTPGGRGRHLDGIYACLHGPEDGCACRKPQPGADGAGGPGPGPGPVTRSYLVGDRYKDIETAANAGVKGILVLTGYGRGEYRISPAASAPVQSRRLEARWSGPGAPSWQDAVVDFQFADLV